MQLFVSALGFLTILSKMLVMFHKHGDALCMVACKKKHMPEPKGQPVRLVMCCWDANLMHDLTTGRSCMGILHMINQTPSGWCAKPQSTVETATHGSEFVAGRTATKQVIDIHCTLRMMGVCQSMVRPACLVTTKVSSRVQRHRI
jgi:hypothetical protein